jgi:hypothetical protein
VEQVPIETLQVGNEQRVWRAFIDFEAADVDDLPGNRGLTAGQSVFN